MIDKLSYDQMLQISKDLSDQAQKIQKMAEARELLDLVDFASTVEGYSKFLENTVELNRDADNALKELREKKR